MDTPPVFAGRSGSITQQDSTLSSAYVGPSVSAAYAAGLEAFLQSEGLTTAGALEVSSAMLTTSRVPGPLFDARLQAAARMAGDALLGVRFGSGVGGASFSMLGLAAVTAGSLRDTIQQLRRFESLVSTLGRTDLLTHGASTALVWRPSMSVSPVVAEAAIGGWVSFGRYLLGIDAQVLEVGFAHSCTASIQDYEQALGCPVRFEAQANYVTFISDLMDARPRMADVGLNESITSLLDPCAAAADWHRHHSTSSRVARVLAEQLSAGEIDADFVAARLNLSARTLQRRLADEGNSYRQQLDSARAHYAILRLFDADVSLAQLGAEVGFEEQSSLCRAFRRWTSLPPLALRRRFEPLFGGGGRR